MRGVIVGLLLVVSVASAPEVVAQVLSGHPLCSAIPDIEKGIYRLALERGAKCWTQLATCRPNSGTDELRTRGNELNHLLFISDQIAADGNVLVVKEVAIGRSQKASRVHLYRPAIAERCGVIVNPNRKKNQPYGRLAGTEEESAERSASVDEEDYINYPRPRLGNPRALSDFHFFYRRTEGKRCVATDNVASGNRSYYDMPQLRPDIRNNPRDALIAYVGSNLAAPFITSAVAKEGEQERYSFLRVRHYPMTRLSSEPESFFYKDFQVRTPESPLEIEYVWAVDLESRDIWDRRTTSCELQLRIPADG